MTSTPPPEGAPQGAGPAFAADGIRVYPDGYGEAAGAFLVPGEGMELATLAPPLLEVATEHVDRQVEVWTAGGTMLDGKLIEVDQERQFLVVDDDRHRMYVDAQAVAVLRIRR